MALTDQKRKYALARLSGLSKKAAAIEAGCPEKTASQAATRYEKDPDVRAVMARSFAADMVNKASKRAVDRVKTQAPQDDEPEADAEPGIIPATENGVQFAFALMNDLYTDPKLRLEAAKLHAAYTMSKPGEKGKKEERAEAAAKASGGRFSSAPPPPRSRLN
jgi:phage terminase small subunit